MRNQSLAVVGVVLIMSLAGCSSHDQEKAQDDAHKAAAKLEQGADKLEQGAKDLGRKVDAAVKPDTESASDKMSAGMDKAKDATAKAGVKLDHAALLAKVKTKLASDAGLSTLTKIDVQIDGSVVTLSGSVSSGEQKKAAELAAAQVEGVTRVNNSLIVAP